MKKCHIDSLIGAAFGEFKRRKSREKEIRKFFKSEPTFELDDETLILRIGLRLQLDHIPVCIIHKNKQGVITYANRHFCNFERKSTLEVLGKTDEQLYTPELAQRYREDDKLVLESRTPFVAPAEEHRDPSNGIIQVVVSKEPIYRNGQLEGVRVIFWNENNSGIRERSPIKAGLITAN